MRRYNANESELYWLWNTVLCEVSERNSTVDAHSYRAPVNIETARDSALRTFYANTSTRGIKKEKGKKKGGKKGKRKWQRKKRDSGGRERASDFSRARPRAVDLASLFSLLSWSCTDSLLPLPGFFPVLSSFFLQIDLAPGDLFQ